MTSTSVDKNVFLLMDDLRDWQSLILQFESLLTWEKPVLLLKVIFLITLFYGVVWFFEPPLISSVGFLVIIVNLTIYFGPILSSRFRVTMPVGEQYRKYLEFCKRLINFRTLTISTFHNRLSVRWNPVGVLSDDRVTFGPRHTTYWSTDDYFIYDSEGIPVPPSPGCTMWTNDHKTNICTVYATNLSGRNVISEVHRDYNIYACLKGFLLFFLQTLVSLLFIC
uniref:ADP-ribosylation factor-like protein 6-interacting protein 1 n=4 Tax=Schistocephalus solidus TaxID=70667 RepID=A0A0X3NHY3_SCHSO